MKQLLGMFALLCGCTATAAERHDMDARLERLQRHDHHDVRSTFAAKATGERVNLADGAATTKLTLSNAGFSVPYPKGFRGAYSEASGAGITISGSQTNFPGCPDYTLSFPATLKGQLEDFRFTPNRFDAPADASRRPECTILLRQGSNSAGTYLSGRGMNQELRIFRRINGNLQTIAVGSEADGFGFAELSKLYPDGTLLFTRKGRSPATDFEITEGVIWTPSGELLKLGTVPGLQKAPTDSTVIGGTADGRFLFGKSSQSYELVLEDWVGSVSLSHAVSYRRDGARYIPTPIALPANFGDGLESYVPYASYATSVATGTLAYMNVLFVHRSEVSLPFEKTSALIFRGYTVDLANPTAPPVPLPLVFKGKGLWVATTWVYTSTPQTRFEYLEAIFETDDPDEPIDHESLGDYLAIGDTRAPIKKVLKALNLGGNAWEVQITETPNTFVFGFSKQVAVAKAADVLKAVRDAATKFE